MDGNRRWAREQGLSSLEGHKAGYEKLKEVLGWAKDAGVHTVIAYAFSTENWKRSKEEVDHILSLFSYFLTNDSHTIEHARIRFIGDRSRFPADMQKEMSNVELRTAAQRPQTIAIALSYGGREEIVQAAQQLIEQGIRTVSERDFANALYTHDIADPDMIIRTGGEQRLSNFLPWQSTYSELFFSKTAWPAFGKNEFERMLQEYGERTRNFGA